MTQQGFEEYTYFAYGRKNGTSNSYISAIRILDRIFSIEDVFLLQGRPLTELDDAYLLQKIADYVAADDVTRIQIRNSTNSRRSVRKAYLTMDYLARQVIRRKASVLLRCDIFRDTRHMSQRRLRLTLLPTS